MKEKELKNLEELVKCIKNKKNDHYEMIKWYTK